jgi:enoyl-CoA hydratase/carnithine racemase
MVHSERKGAVHTLTLDSPHNRNALSAQLLEELAAGLHDATTAADVRVIVLTATGTVFCSGADLSGTTGTVTSRMAEILSALAAAPVPVIARVNGHARAGGLGLMAASDLAVAATGATFAFSEVRVGVAPAMIMVPGLRVMAPRFLSQHVLTGESFTAVEAARAGLLSAVTEDEAALDAWVDAAVAGVLKSAPGAVAATKALLAGLPELSWSAGLEVARARSAELFDGVEAAEGMDAFLNKRSPSWDVTSS